jgi:hypothetical protein
VKGPGRDKLLPLLFRRAAAARLVFLHLQEAQRIGDDFLALEKYVNINYLVRAVARNRASASLKTRASRVAPLRPCTGLPQDP